MSRTEELINIEKKLEFKCKVIQFNFTYYEL